MLKEHPDEGPKQASGVIRTSGNVGIARAIKLGYRMNIFRIALANIRFPASPKESVTLAEQAIAQASIERAGLICFPECFIPGYRAMGKAVPPPDSRFLERAWSA